MPLRTLDDALKANRGVGPGFHLLRHLLSLVILVHHCRVAVFGVHATATYDKSAAMTVAVASHLTRGQLVIEVLRPGLYALVGMFFALSGFLVVGSALRNSSIKVFFANRALRILPALSVEVTLSAIVLGPLVTNMPFLSYVSDPEFLRYFGNIAGQITFRLPGVFLSNPWPGMVNANLWTLPAEFWCYLLMLLMMASGTLLHHKRLTIAILTALVAVVVLTFFNSEVFSIRQDSTHYTQWYIVMLFFFGVMFYINARAIPLHPLLFLAACISYYLLTLFDVLGPVSGLFLTYCMVYVGMTRFPTFDRLLKVDLSYGTYLYGFPITQAVVYFLLPRLGATGVLERYLIIQPIVIILTLLFASISWRYIEKPALALRRYVLPGAAKGVEVKEAAVTKLLRRQA